MQQQVPFRSPAFLTALAVLFAGLLLSTTVLPTLLSCSTQTCMAAPAPVEEEQLHSRDVHKLGTVPDRSWCCSALLLGQRMRAAFRDRDVALPNGPISDVPLQPPKVA